MKTRTSRINLFLIVGAASLVAFGTTAQTSAPASTGTATPPPSDSAPPKLPYGVDDVVKLSRAQISEDVTLNYIQNSGTIYNLGPQDIVNLRNEGVSDKVINVMLDQRRNVPVDVANQNALQAQAAASATGQAPANADPGSAQAAPLCVQSPPLCVQPAPDYDPASTLYVIPYGSSGCAYYRYPSSYYGIGYGGASTVVSIHNGYGGTRNYNGSRRGGARGSSTHHFGRR